MCVCVYECVHIFLCTCSLGRHSHSFNDIHVSVLRTVLDHCRSLAPFTCVHVYLYLYMCVGGGAGWWGYVHVRTILCASTCKSPSLPHRRRPVPPNCVDVAAVMTDLTIAPPNDDCPLIQGLASRPFLSLRLLLYHLPKGVTMYIYSDSFLHVGLNLEFRKGKNILILGETGE